MRANTQTDSQNKFDFHKNLLDLTVQNKLIGKKMFG